MGDVPTGEHTFICRELLSELSAYIDGEAAADVCAAIEGHLAACADCRALVDTMRKTMQLAHELPPPALTDAAKERLLLVLHLKDKA